MAGIYGLARSRFLLFDGLGILLWIGTFELLGYLFSDQLEAVVAYASRFGGLLTVLFVGGLAAYVWLEVRAATQIPPLAARSAHHPGAVEGGVGLRHGPLDR